MTMTRLKGLTIGLLTVAVLAAAQTSWAQSRVMRRVWGHQTATSTVWLSPGWHQVTVDGDGDTDLDLYVYDGAGRLVAVDDDETDYCVGRFFLRRGGYVTIRIRNLGRVYNEYSLSVR